MSEGEAPQACNGFTFFRSYRSCVKRLKSTEMKLAVLLAIIDYGLDGTRPADTEDGMLGAILEGIIPNIDNSRRVKNARSDAGKRGGRPPGKPPILEGTPTPDGKQTKANESKNKQTKANESGIGIGTGNGMGIGTGIGNGTGDIGSGNIPNLLSEAGNSALSISPSSGNPPKKSYKGSQTNSLQAKHPKAYDFWERIRKVYPSARRHAPCVRTLRFIEERKLWEQEEAITKSIVAWSNCDEWKLGYVLRMSRFIEEEHWKEEPPAPKGPEIRNIHRIISTHAPMEECSEDTDIPTL